MFTYGVQNSVSVGKMFTYVGKKTRWHEKEKEQEALLDAAAKAAHKLSPRA